MTQTPTLLRHTATISGGFLFFSAALGCFLALKGVSVPLWGMFSFEITLLVTGLLGVLLGFGKFSPGFGMGAAVLGATAVGATVLGYVDARSNLSATWVGPYLKPMVFGRLAFSLVLIGSGGFDVLRRDRMQIRRFVLGVVVLLPVVGFGLAAFAGRLGFLFSGGAGTAELVRVAALFLLGIIGIVLVSLGGHLIITAFLSASEDDDLIENRV